MTALRANVEFAKRIFFDRLGNEYVYGGNWNPNDIHIGTDCSGLVVDELDACINGTAMAWSRHGMSTESWRPIEVGQVGPFGTITVASPHDYPSDAVVKIALHHGPGGGENSHMVCEVDGIAMESGGSGCVTSPQAMRVDDPYFNDWAYLPGPIVDVQPPQPQPMSQQDLYAVAVIREGQRRNISPRGIMIALSVPFVESGWKVYANSNVPESLNYPHDAVGSDHDSTGLFQQRQAWGPLSCTMDAACSAGLFFDGGDGGQRGLTDFDYNDESRSPGSYAQAVQVSAYPDRYDLYWQEAVDLYNRLAGAAPIPPLAPVPEEDWMANLELEQMIRDLHAALFTPQVSKSRYADERTWTLAEKINNMDGMLFDLKPEHDAALGDPWSIQAVRAAAARGDQIAAAYLARLTTPPSTTPTPPPAVTPPPAPPPTPPQPQPIPNLPSTNGNRTKTTGQLIGELYEALNALRLADAMPIEARAPMQALIQVLATKNGLM